MSEARQAEVLRHLQPQRGEKLWYGGATAQGAIRGITPQAAAWKPTGGSHSMWELILHVAYWDYVVQRRIVEGPRGGFPRSPSNWPALPSEINDATWQADRAVAREAHKALVNAVRDFDSARYDEPAGDDSGTTFGDLLMGIVMHDTYHAGQIKLLKGLHANASGTPLPVD